VALYPAHEIEAFTTLFWNRIQYWRETEAPRPLQEAPQAPTVIAKTAPKSAPSLADQDTLDVPLAKPVRAARTPKATAAVSKPAKPARAKSTKSAPAPDKR